MPQTAPDVEKRVGYNRRVCTLTWHDTTDGYRVFFNRDERHERKPGIPPAVRRTGDTRFIAPLDGDHHGTWIAANEYGLCVCLLNGFPATGVSERNAYTTRGALPMTAARERSTAGIADWLATVELERFRPFALVVFAPAGDGLVARWSGAELDLSTARPADQPLVSSSFYTEEVRRSREAVFARLVSSGPGPTTRHLAFHRSHLPRAGPHSPCMHRDDARTVSFSRIDVGPRSVEFRYAPHSPCLGIPDRPAATLERRGPG